MTMHTTNVHSVAMWHWQAYCEQCGDIGIPEQNEQDANAIAVRHEEIGGFG